MQDQSEFDYDEFLIALGRRIKQVRKERGLSLRDMTVKHGYHDSQWRRYERGGGANLNSLHRIAAAFNTSLSELLEGLGPVCTPRPPAKKDGEQVKNKQVQPKPPGSKTKKKT